MKNNALTIILIFSSFALWAQEQDLDTQEVNVIEQFIPKVTPARKITDIPKVVDTIKDEKKIYYSTLINQYQTSYKIDTIKAANIKGEPIPKLYANFLELRMGKAAVPFFRGYHNSLRNKQWSYGVEFGFHNSSAKVEGFDAGFQETLIAAFGKGILDLGILNAAVKREGNTFSAHAKQADLSDDQLHQYWGYSQLNLTFESKHNSRNRLHHHTRLFMKDLNEMTENNYGFESKLKKRFGDYDYSLLLKADLYSNNVAESMPFATDLIKEGLYTLSPRILAELYDVQINAGFDETINTFQSDSTYTNFHFYPQIRADYEIIPSIFKIYGGVRSALTKNSYWSLSKENPFLLNALRYDGDAIKLKNTSSTNFYAGLNTFVNSAIRLGAKFSFANSTAMPFFSLNQSRWGNKFAVEYYSGTHTQLKADVSYSDSAKKGLDMSILFQRYILDKVYAKTVNALYKPKVEVSLSYFYNVGDKIIFNLSFYSAFGRQFQHPNSSALTDNEQMKDIVDFDFKIEYKYNKVMSAYLSGKNCLGGYEIWQNYPVVPRQIQLGISYQF